MPLLAPILRQPCLQFAYNAKGELVHVDTVPRGKNCGCYCPECHAPLVAKNGSLWKQHHFAHAQNTACSGAPETALHLLAKDVLQQTCALMLPRYGDVFSGGLQRFSRMEVEERHDASNLQPDCVGVVRHQQHDDEARLLIEVRVHHAVDADKMAKIRALDLPCIELDMRRFLHAKYQRSDIVHFLLHSKSDRRWLFNPRMARLQQEYERQTQQTARQRITMLRVREREVVQAHKGSRLTDMLECQRCQYREQPQDLSPETPCRHALAVLPYRPVPQCTYVVCGRDCTDEQK